MSELVEIGEVRHPQPFKNTKARTGARASERGQYRTPTRKGIYFRTLIKVNIVSACLAGAATKSTNLVPYGAATRSVSMLSPMRAAEAFTVSRAKCAYRAVVCTWV